jgi:hypothetical protein
MVIVCRAAVFQIAAEIIERPLHCGEAVQKVQRPAELADR